jgi:hypothetical protein
VLELIDGSHSVRRLLIVLAVAELAAPLYVLAARRLPLRLVVTVALGLDTLFIAAMDAALRNPNAGRPHAFVLSLPREPARVREATPVSSART